MANPLKFLPMILAQQLGGQKLHRQQEPEALTEDEANVVQYDQVMTTKLAVAYALGMEIVFRARTEPPPGASKAIDLACGPGHYTLCLKRYLKYDQVDGVDLAPNMVKTASANARKMNVEKSVRFSLGDITDLRQFQDASYDLTSFTDAAHHMPDMSVVTRILREMDRLTKPDGLVMLMDLARLRTARLTENYVEFLGGDYEARGLTAFKADFRNSMYAAWTYQELATGIPKDSARVWAQLVFKPLPTLQIVLGLPVGRKTVLVRSGVPWAASDSPVPSDSRLDWTFARMSLLSARARLFPPEGEHI